ncbi:hypothetical protein FLONG3_4948 [Fusarium longipes]|uniref:Uncharacterized protein n=1 Tax=Fusarium longipes TaxID=694270 RepID=A0A395SY25_9HYPO|nr:hypothetical protein FLONG3_4948 [Fusarium longipes]
MSHTEKKSSGIELADVGNNANHDYSPLGEDDSNITTPTREQPTAGLDPSTKSFVVDSADSEKITYWKSFKGPEAPKAVCGNGVWNIVRHLALLHVLPIGITLTLLGLYIREVRWGDLTSEQLNALQFAAKGHEILILVSLTDILLQRISYSLLHEDGVPLGFLSAPFYLGAPIQYLFSWEFWSGLVQPGIKPKTAGSWVTGTIIIVTIILSVAAAPLSAIVMIPREGWWQFTPRLDSEEQRISYFKPDIYPTNLGKNQTDLYLIDIESNRSLVDDPLSLLLPAIWDVPLYDAEAKFRQEPNISYTNYPKYFESNRLVLSTPLQQLNDTSTSVQVTTTPMDTLAADYASNWWWYSKEPYPSNLLIKLQRRSLNAPLRKWKQPLVVVECASNRTKSADISFHFSSLISSNTEVNLTFENNEDFKDLVTKGRKIRPNTFPELRHRVLASSNETSPLISAEFLFLEDMPRHYSGNGTLLDPSDAPTGDYYPIFGFGLHLCRVSARWAEADMWFDRRRSYTMQSQFEYPLGNLEKLVGQSAETYETIKMQKEWLEAVGRRRNQTTGIQDPEKDSIWEKTIYLADKRRYAYGWAVNSTEFLQETLGIHFADILSRMGPSFFDRKGLRNSDTNDGKPPLPDDFIVDQTFFLGGFGYSINSSSTIPLALGILLLHVAIVLIHTAVIIFSRRRWLSSCWTSFGKLLVLALRSEKHDLGNVGGGVESSQTWSTSAVVRAIGDEKRLEMVLKKRGKSDGLINEEEYGNEDGIRTEYSRVEPGVRYR